MVEFALILAAVAVLLAAVAVLPGSLGIVTFTHRMLARPRGAFLFNVLARAAAVGDERGAPGRLLGLCMAYELDDEFSGSGIYVTSVLANNLVFYDKTNGCTVLQIQNRARDDSYRLKTLPTLHASLATWKHFYPESKVWFRPHEWRDTFYLKLLARALVIDPASSDLVYPLEREPDDRLPLKGLVMGVSLGGETKAFALDVFGHNPVVEDMVGGEPIVFLASEDADLVHLFSRRTGPSSVDGRTLPSPEA